MQCCRIVNGIKNKNIKNSLGAKWNASHLACFECADTVRLHRNMPKACPYAMMRLLMLFYLIKRKFRFQKFCFSPKASGFYPFGDATDLVRGRR